MAKPKNKKECGLHKTQINRQLAIATFIWFVKDGKARYSYSVDDALAGEVVDTFKTKQCFSASY